METQNSRQDLHRTMLYNILCRIYTFYCVGNKLLVFFSVPSNVYKIVVSLFSVVLLRVSVVVFFFPCALKTVQGSLVVVIVTKD